mmetsp:Transcript_7859/g.11872  ORF Transcript_7859/g.11872 Transcript_7859/m.11872 type:complete len:304 (+) Transcript_7859:49-960(+)
MLKLFSTRLPTLFNHPKHPTSILKSLPDRFLNSCLPSGMPRSQKMLSFSTYKEINYGEALDLPPNLKLSIKCKSMIYKAQQESTPPPPTTLDLPMHSMNTGKSNGEVSLEPSIFNHEIRRDIAHTVIKWQLACRRQGSAKTKGISEVRGSGRKVRKQKGGGVARAGHGRPAHWRGGVKAHGPKGNRDWSYKLHKKVRKMGLRVVLSAKLKENKLTVIDTFETESHRTALIAEQLKNLNLDKSTLFVDGKEINDNFALATRNIPGVKAVWGGGANCYDIVKHENLAISKSGLEFLSAKLKIEQS